jgi:hypothetical protein
MTDDEFELALRATNPISDAQVSAFDLHSGALELMEDLMSTPFATELDLNQIDCGTDQQPKQMYRSAGRRRALMMTAGLVAAAVAAVALVVIPRGGNRSAYAAEAVRVAQANERLLIGASGWAIVAVPEFTADQGETHFSDGTHQIEIHWRKATEYQQFLDDRAVGSTTTPITLTGQSATMFAGDSTYRSVMTHPNGVNFIEVQADLGSEEAFTKVLATFRAVDVSTWLAALPADVVKPVDRATVVAKMLADMPLPPGLNASNIATGVSTNDYYQLGAAVTGTVACAWFDQFFKASEAVDNAKRQQAIDALESSHNWPVLKQMQSAGGWSAAVWGLADAASGVSPYPQPMTRDDVVKALGCDRYAR